MKPNQEGPLGRPGTVISNHNRTPNADRVISDKLKEVNRIEGLHPDNLVLVAVEDVIEIFHELQPYTIKKLDEIGHLL